MRERDIERHLVQRVKALGGEVRKVKWIGRNGAPDRLVMLPAMPKGSTLIADLGRAVLQWERETHRPQTTWVELKRPGGKLEAHQAREHTRMMKMGQRVLVLDTIEKIDAEFPI